MAVNLPDEILELFNKSKAYKRVFMKDGKLTKDAEVVIKDLAKFCKANQSTTVFNPISRSVDPLASAIADGRREVYLRLSNYLKLDEADFIKKDETYNDQD